MRSLAQVLSDENRALRPIAEAESYQIMASKNGARRLLRNNTGQRMGLKVSDLLETDQYRDAGRRRTRCDGWQGFGVLDLKSFADALRLGWCVETISPVAGWPHCATNRRWAPPQPSPHQRQFVRSAQTPSSTPMRR